MPRKPRGRSRYVHLKRLYELWVQQICDVLNDLGCCYWGDPWEPRFLLRGEYNAIVRPYHWMDSPIVEPVLRVFPMHSDAMTDLQLSHLIHRFGETAVKAAIGKPWADWMLKTALVRRKALELRRAIVNRKRNT